MPIRPENRERYPKDWRSVVVPRIRRRSHNRCECTGQCGVNHGPHPVFKDLAIGRCGIRNGEIGYYNWRRDWNISLPTWLGEVEIDSHGIERKIIKIVLTVAHLNHTPEDCRDENLLHMCQGCHNRYDAPMRRAGIQARARAQRASADLFQCQEAS